MHLGLEVVIVLMFCSLDSRIYIILYILYTSYIMLLLSYTRISLMTSDMTLIVQVMSFFPDQ